MSHDDARRLRASLDARIVAQSAGGDATALRRRLAYQRVLRRLGMDERGGWVLKGGYLLEARLPDTSRATRDLDLAMRAVATDVARALDEALLPDPDGDNFNFAVTKTTQLATDARGNRAWRLSLRAVLDARTFAELRIDIVERLDEIGDATETILVAPPLLGTGLSGASILAVNIPQHAAEKFHALCLVFADGRQNTRVKDLLDIVLLAEAGLLPHPRLPDRLIAVFAARDGSAPPEELPAPPASWRSDFALLAKTTGALTAELDSAFALAHTIYRENRLPSRPPHDESAQ